MAMSYGGNVVGNFYDDRISWIEHPLKRLFITVGTYLTYAFIVSFILVFFFGWLRGQFSLTNIPWGNLAKNATLPMFIALIIMAIFTTRSWLLEWKKSALETEILKSEILSSQYQSLKDQLNPHFLFNALNALTNLVYEDADRSAEFIQKLSKIYRYVLEIQNEDLVSLNKELEFAENYLDLQKVRFENKLKFQLKMDESTSYFIPPLSLQLLLENAIKNNEESFENPLEISIIQHENELWISNILQPKSTKIEESTGVGLDNIQQRYAILCKRNIVITQHSNIFIVKISLLTIYK